MLEKISKEEKQSANSEDRITRVVHAFPRPLFSDQHPSSSSVSSCPVRLITLS